MVELPEDVLTFLCYIVHLDDSGWALRLIEKYRPDIIEGFARNAIVPI